MISQQRLVVVFMLCAWRTVASHLYMVAVLSKTELVDDLFLKDFLLEWLAIVVLDKDASPLTLLEHFASSPLHMLPYFFTGNNKKMILRRHCSDRLTCKAMTYFCLDGLLPSLLCVDAGCGVGVAFGTLFFDF